MVDTIYLGLIYVRHPSGKGFLIGIHSHLCLIVAELSTQRKHVFQDPSQISQQNNMSANSAAKQGIGRAGHWLATCGMCPPPTEHTIKSTQ